MKTKKFYWFAVLITFIGLLFCWQSAAADVMKGKIQYYHGESTSESTVSTTISSEQTIDSELENAVDEQMKNDEPNMLAQLGEAGNLLLIGVGVVLFGVAIYYLVLLRRNH